MFETIIEALEWLWNLYDLIADIAFIPLLCLAWSVIKNS